MPHSPSTPFPNTFDVAIIGAGIVGLATAWALTQRRPQLRIVILEKEPTVAQHQTGHNSGVVHSGIYYRPGSHKAWLCREGVGLLEEFCAEHELPYQRCGKVIVATEAAELPALDELFERGVANGVPDLRLVDRDELHRLEPRAAGLRAIHSPATAITDYGAVARKLAELLTERGVSVKTGAELLSVTNTENGLELRGRGFEFATHQLVNCAGLYSDVVATLCGVLPTVRIVPFRGEYYQLAASRRDYVNGLIYPVPDARLPFLGVHFTRTVSGEVEAGPNAVLAFAREGYAFTRLVPHELLGTLGFAGFWRLARRFWRVGAFETYRSLNKPVFVRSLQRLMPSITAADLQRGSAGVRAQAVDEHGQLIDDFVFADSYHALHVLNAPSPAATASFAIGKYLAERVESSL